MGKSRAAVSHLWPSALVLAVIAGLVLVAWYPYPFLQFKGVTKFSILLILSASFIGPALTWLVYGKGKRGLVFDLIVIILIQVTAISWGTHALYQNRPYFMVFTLDRFEVLSIQDVNIGEITDPKFLDKTVAGPILLYANMPTDQQIYQKLFEEIMFEGKPDLQFRPEFWSLYAEKQHLVIDVSQPLEQLRSLRPEYTGAIDKLVNINGGDISHLKFVPVMLANGHFAAILDADSGVIVDNLAIDPWITK